MWYAMRRGQGLPRGRCLGWGGVRAYREYGADMSRGED